MTTQQQYFHVDDEDINVNNDNFVKPVHYTKQLAAAAAHSFKQVRKLAPHYLFFLSKNKNTQQPNFFKL
jgi:hypothetical protein